MVLGVLVIKVSYGSFDPQNGEENKLSVPTSHNLAKNIQSNFYQNDLGINTPTEQKTHKSVEEWADELKYNTVAFDRDELISAIAKTPRRQRDTIITLATTFMTEEMSGYDLADFIDNIRKISRRQRSEIVAKLHPFITPSMDGRGRALFINTVREIPRRQRDDVLGRARPFITDYMKGNNFIIDAIKNIPSSQRDDVLTKAGRFFIPGMSQWEYSCIINAIKGIPCNQRKSVLAQLRIFFTPGMKGPDCSQIINTLMSIPETQRASVVARLKPFIRNDNPAYFHVILLESISSFSTGQQERIICHTQEQLYQDEEDGKLPPDLINRTRYIMDVFQEKIGLIREEARASRELKAILGEIGRRNPQLCRWGS